MGSKLCQTRNISTFGRAQSRSGLPTMIFHPPIAVVRFCIAATAVLPVSGRDTTGFTVFAGCGSEIKLSQDSEAETLRPWQGMGMNRVVRRKWRSVTKNRSAHKNDSSYGHSHKTYSAPGRQVRPGKMH